VAATAHDSSGEPDTNRVRATVPTSTSGKPAGLARWSSRAGTYWATSLRARCECSDIRTRHTGPPPH